jgi:hypothetical protein
MLVFSRKLQNNNQAAKDWRSELAYRSLLLLSAAVSVVEYHPEQSAVWEVPERSGQELEYCKPTDAWRRYAQTLITIRRDSMRVPLQMAYLLR